MDQVRTIDAGAPPARFARGWHCLGLAGRFRAGGPHAVQAFGTKLVVFADSGGALHVLDGYCRHMGGDLTQGTVKGDAIACPFHDWRWGGDGRCASIPYARRVPVAARTRSWRTLERNGQLFVWHDPEGNPPPAEVDIPRIDGAGSSEWTEWTWDSILVEGANCREVIDNVVDMAHFFYIHFAFPTYFKNVFEGHVASQYLRTRSRPDVGGTSNYADGSGETTLRSEASYFGPAYMIDNLWHDYHGMTMESVLINCHYPVTPTSFLLQWGAIVKRPPGLSDAQASRVAAKFADFVGLGFRPGRADLDEQDPDRQPAAVRRGRAGLPGAPLVRAVLLRRGRHRAGHGGAVRVRDRHRPRGGRLGGGGRGQPRRTAGGSGPAAAGGQASRSSPARLMQVTVRGRRVIATSGGESRARWSARAAGRPCWRSSSARSTLPCSGPRRRCGRAGSSPRPRPSALVEGCGSLRDSIDVAVAAGRLAVSPP